MVTKMIDWEQINYDISKATKDYDELSMDLSTPYNLSNDMQELRMAFLEARDKLYDKYNLDSVEKLGYDFDLRFGLKVYSILSHKVGFTNRTASNDDVWRYLSIKIIPDIVHSRWGRNEVRTLTSRRIWLKNLWWYIHLSWAGNSEETFNLLKNNTTDTVVQLVERPGIGYYTDLYRELMKQYANINDSSRNIFRRALKLNTALLPVSYPELMDGGIPEYIEYVFSKVQ
ncbi:TPA: hypothetical protein ACGO9B_001491 [Streptococcus suis]